MLAMTSAPPTTYQGLGPRLLGPALHSPSSPTSHLPQAVAPSRCTWLLRSPLISSWYERTRHVGITMQAQPCRLAYNATVLILDLTGWFMERRRFISTAIAGSAEIAIFGVCSATLSRAKRTGLTVPILCVGSAPKPGKGVTVAEL